LGFVVEQYEKVKSFVSEPFWYISISIVQDDERVNFSWDRGHIFDKETVEAFLRVIEDAEEAEVKSVKSKETKKL
jgi:DNA topoisomerase III